GRAYVPLALAVVTHARVAERVQQQAVDALRRREIAGVEVDVMDKSVHGGALRRDATARAYFLSRLRPPKRLLKHGTRPTVSSTVCAPPVHAGCVVGSISRSSVSPSFPHVERVW